MVADLVEVAVLDDLLVDLGAVELAVGKANVTRKSDGRSVDVLAGDFAATKKGVMASTTLPPRENAPRDTWTFPSGPVLKIVAAPKGSHVAIATWDSALVLRDGQSGEELAVWRDQTKSLNSLAYAAEAGQLASGSNDKFAKVREGLTGKEIVSTKKQKSDVRAVALSPNGKWLATGGSLVKGLPELKIHDATTGAASSNKMSR